MGALSPIHLLIILAIVLLLFGGSRLAGLGKSSGRALREFKEETKGLREKDDERAAEQQTPQVESTGNTTSTTTASGTTISGPSETERVENPAERRDA